MAKRPKIAFLYSELAGYFMACIDELKKEADVLIIRWPVNKEAPFQFDFSGIECLEKSELPGESLIEKVKDFKPDLLFCSGWMDKDYLTIAKHFRKEIPVLVGMDNPWFGNFKQRLASVLARPKLHRHFSHAWVAGEPQAKFARKLGFKGDKLLTGLYSADYKLYDKFYNETIEEKKKNFPKRFLYIGRYVEWKGINEMWDGFVKANAQNGNEWELLCIGTGELFEQRPELPNVKHIGFVQPKDFKQYLEATSVFVLPSKYEPWGVVAHEMAISGYPMIISEKVGASSAFLQENKNGILVNDVNSENMASAFSAMMTINQPKWNEMSDKSRFLAEQINPNIWVENIKGLI